MKIRKTNMEYRFGLNLKGSTLARYGIGVFILFFSLHAGLWSRPNTGTVGLVAFEIQARSDLKLGIPLLRRPVVETTISDVSGHSLTLVDAIPEFSGQPHYLLISTPGSDFRGEWFEISGVNGAEVILVDDVEALGIQAGEACSVIPFWTLETLFSDASQFPLSSNVFNPEAQVLLNDVTLDGTNLPPVRAYVHHDGTQGPAGWYDVNDLGAGRQGDTVINPETFITIRNAAYSPQTIYLAGRVPTYEMRVPVRSWSGGAQDSLVPNPYPVDIALNQSELVGDGVVRPSPDPFNPVDQLLLYPASPATFNPVPEKVLLYHDGSLGPEGWYDVNNLAGGPVDTLTIPMGAALVVRKQAGPDALVDWTPPPPYSF